MLRVHVHVEIVEGSAEGSRLQSVQFFHLRRPVNRIADNVPLPATHLSGVQREPQSGLAASQRLLGALPLRDVEDRSHPSATLVSGIEQLRECEQSRETVAVGAAEFQFQAIGRSVACKHPFELLLSRLNIICGPASKWRTLSDKFLRRASD